MTKPRSEQVSIEDTPFYHCMVHCVRRAFLCGDDHETGENFDHRKQWLVSRLRFLSYVYAIDICAYAVMSNHYHVVLHVDNTRAENWSLDEVVERWLQLYKGDKLIQKWIAFRAQMSKAELKKAEEIIEQWRERLTSIQQRIFEFFNAKNNDESNTKSSKNSKDQENKINTKLTNRNQKRIQSKIQNQRKIEQSLQLDSLPKVQLKPLHGSLNVDITDAIPITFANYLELVETTGKCIRDDKRGFISNNLEAIIQTLGFTQEQWITHVKNFTVLYSTFVGSKETLKAKSVNDNKCWYKGASLVS